MILAIGHQAALLILDNTILLDYNIFLLLIFSETFGSEGHCTLFVSLRCDLSKCQCARF